MTVKNTQVTDTTLPPVPTSARQKGNKLIWPTPTSKAAWRAFLIERDGKFLADVPEKAVSPFGGPVFQQLEYNDTPMQPLVPRLRSGRASWPGSGTDVRGLLWG